ncbi:MAG: ComEC/Rec2 family competence protein [Candidatus Levybacteria bacterium]|nr:ComEC/Rec2 family competence protein [Candidatus Levybacteria bacterium]MBP9815227.1 ComEC/Rec2 family competence protein [Candidatus Levybacteria bacterium]
MKLIVIFILILSLVLGMRYAFYFSDLSTVQAGDYLQKEIVLLSEPITTDYYQTIRVGEVVIEMDKFPRYAYGDRIILKGTIENNIFIAKSGQEVIQLVVRDPSIQKIPTNNIFIESAAFLRVRVQKAFNHFLPQNEASLLFGIVFGGSQGFSKDLTTAFKNSGVLHVVAASGMNVTIVGAFLIAMFSYIFKRRTALILGIAGVFYYALVSGLSPSIMRASIMASIAFSAAIFGRQNYGILTLILTAFIMLIITPSNITNVGFLLSFSSTLGIIIIKPLFDKIRLVQKTKGISDDITMTTSAQIGSLPVMASIFGSYSAISIIVNALVLWTIPPLMILGGIAAFVAVIQPSLSIPFLYLSYPILLYFKAVIVFFGSIPLLKTGNIPIFIGIGYYLFLFGIVILLNKHNEK